MDLTKKAIDLTLEEKLALLGGLFYCHAKEAMENGHKDTVADMRLKWIELHPDVPGHKSAVEKEFHFLFTQPAELHVNIKECTVGELVKTVFPRSYKEILQEACNGFC